MQQSRSHAVVDVVRVVGDLVGQVDELCLEAGLGAVDKAPRHAVWLDRLERMRVAHRAALENALTRFERQVQAVECRMLLLEPVDDAQALQVVFETAIGLVLQTAQAGIEGLLPGMPERGVAKVVCECDRLDQIFVQTQCARR